MVCIAAFIILIVVGVFVAFISIFKRDLGKKYLKVLKKSWHCFTRHLTFRKCDTSFQDDVKTALLKKVVLKKPEAVKPLSITIEVASILIVIVTAWSLIEGVKAGLAVIAAHSAFANATKAHFTCSKVDDHIIDTTTAVG